MVELTLNEFMDKLKEYDSQIKSIEKEKENFFNEHYYEMNNKWIDYIEDRKTMFLELFPLIMKNKKFFTRPTSEYTLDMFNIFVKVGKPLGTGALIHNGIALKNLIQLWNNGFMYEGNPILEYKYFDGKATITYIEDGEYKLTKIEPLDKDIINMVEKLSFHIKQFDNTYTKNLHPIKI